MICIIRVYEVVYGEAVKGECRTVPARVVVGVQTPVPHQSVTIISMAQTNPVLYPHPCDRYVMC